jgi:8-oxo-dGTP pyrophosphatase MutT (NUDIX family)
LEPSQLLQLLSAYHPGDPAERAMLQRTINLVREYPAECASRTLLHGHLTASAWILNAHRTHTLLTHHRKLNRWLQLGGHADGDLNLERVALREAQEESGLTSVQSVASTPFDVDVHTIPSHKGVPEHLHYDVRFLCSADQAEPLVISDESLDLRWMPLEEWKPTDVSQQRLMAKTALISMQGLLGQT